MVVGQWRDMLSCSGVQRWICSCVVVVNGGICSGAELVIGGYAYVQRWSMVDMLTCRSCQLCICSGAVVVNGGYAHM